MIVAERPRLITTMTGFPKPRKTPENGLGAENHLVIVKKISVDTCDEGCGGSGGNRVEIWDKGCPYERSPSSCSCCASGVQQRQRQAAEQSCGGDEDGGKSSGERQEGSPICEKGVFVVVDDDVSVCSRDSKERDDEAPESEEGKGTVCGVAKENECSRRGVGHSL